MFFGPSDSDHKKKKSMVAAASLVHFCPSLIAGVIWDPLPQRFFFSQRRRDPASKDTQKNLFVASVGGCVFYSPHPRTKNVGHFSFLGGKNGYLHS